MRRLTFRSQCLMIFTCMHSSLSLRNAKRVEHNTIRFYLGQMTTGISWSSNKFWVFVDVDGSLILYSRNDERVNGTRKEVDMRGFAGSASILDRWLNTCCQPCWEKLKACGGLWKLKYVMMMWQFSESRCKKEERLMSWIQISSHWMRVAPPISKTLDHPYSISEGSDDPI